METYINDDTTSKRHRDLTRLLLRFYDAVFTIFATTALLLGNLRKQNPFCNLLCQLRENLGKDRGGGFKAFSGGGEKAFNI